MLLFVTLATIFQGRWSALVRPGSTATLARRQWQEAEGAVDGGMASGATLLPPKFAGLHGAALRQAVARISPIDGAAASVPGGSTCASR